MRCFSGIASIPSKIFSLSETKVPLSRQGKDIAIMPAMLEALFYRTV